MATIQIRVDDKIKAAADSLFNSLGQTLIYWKQLRIPVTAAIYMGHTKRRKMRFPHWI